MTQEQMDRIEKRFNMLEARLIAMQLVTLALLEARGVANVSPATVTLMVEKERKILLANLQEFPCTPGGRDDESID